jgi:hypothetical protein
MATYSTPDGKRSKDRPSPIMMIMPPALSGIFFFLGALGLCVCSLIGVYFYYHRNSNLIKASQPPMLGLILLGEVVTSLRVIVAGIVVSSDDGTSDWKCAADLWFGHLGPCLIFSAIFLKMWRIDKVINSGGLKRVKITNTDIFLYGCVAVGLVTTYLAILDGVAKPHVKMSVFTLNNQDTHHFYCDEYISEMEDALFGVEAFLILWGIRLAFATRNAPSVVNESASVAAASGVIIVLFGVGLPVAHLLDLDTVTNEIIAGFFFSIGIFATLGFAFGSKVYHLLFGEKDVASKLKIKNINAHIERSFRGQGIDTKAAHDVLKNKTLDEQFAHCKKEIAYWQAVLVAVEEKRSSDSSTGVSSYPESSKPSSDGNRRSIASSSVVPSANDSEGDVNITQTETLSAGLAKIEEG